MGSGEVHNVIHKHEVVHSHDGRDIVQVSLMGDDGGHGDGNCKDVVQDEAVSSGRGWIRWVG